jgi:hypothetical protein
MRRVAYPLAANGDSIDVEGHARWLLVEDRHRALQPDRDVLGLHDAGEAVGLLRPVSQSRTVLGRAPVALAISTSERWATSRMRWASIVSTLMGLTVSLLRRDFVGKPSMDVASLR